MNAPGSLSTNIPEFAELEKTVQIAFDCRSKDNLRVLNEMISRILTFPELQNLDLSSKNPSFCNVRSLCQFSAIWIKTIQSIAEYMKDGLDMTEEVNKTNECFKRTWEAVSREAAQGFFLAGMANHMLNIGLEQNENFVHRKAAFKKIVDLTNQLKNQLGDNNENADSQIKTILDKMKTDLKLNDDKDSLSQSKITALLKNAISKIEALRSKVLSDKQR